MNAVGIFRVPMKESKSGYGEEEKFWKREYEVGRCKKQEFVGVKISLLPLNDEEL